MWVQPNKKKDACDLVGHVEKQSNKESCYISHETNKSYHKFVLEIMNKQN